MKTCMKTIHGTRFYYCMEHDIMNRNVSKKSKPNFLADENSSGNQNFAVVPL